VASGLSADLVSNLGQTVVNLLAVIGGAAVGWFGAGLLTQLLVKLTVHRDTPRPVLRVVRILGAVALGLAVWLLVFGSGGPGWGLGGGGWGFGGRGPGGADSSTGRTAGTDNQKGKTSKDGKAGSSVEGRFLAVEMLGGKRYKDDERFYRITEPGEPPRSLPELVDSIRKRREQDPGLKGIEIIIYDTGSVAESHPAVAELKRRAQEMDLAVKTSKPGTDAPDSP
jgi:hypothetical protein